MRSPPVTGMIFGILNIGYGAFNLLGLLFLQVILNSVAQNPNSPFKSFFTDPDQMHWMRISGLITAVAGIFLMAAGVGLLLRQNWGRILSLAWAIFDVLFVLASIPLSWNYSHQASHQYGHVFAMAITLMSLFINLVPPALLFIFLNRPKLVAAYKNPALV